MAALFQDIEGRDAPAFDVLYKEGLPQLIRIFDARIQSGTQDDTDDLLFVLKILAMYGSRQGAGKIVEAARRPLAPEAYLWHVILAVFSEGHPQREYVFRALSDPLPTGFLAVALLDSANSAAIEGELKQHPFDSPAGWKQLQHWLEDSDPDHASYAHSAAAALPFVSNPARDQLFALAMDHADISVQMEAAWAAADLGREAGLKVLARFCLDVNHSHVAQRYLAELDREDLIPDETRDLSFQAKAKLARWLAHPSELGSPPDELEITDHRQLAWPPSRELRPFWLLRYRLADRTGLEEDDVGCGLVGSTTWCFFSYNMDQRPPEDVYAIHCYWEMENTDLIDETEVTDASEYAGLLRQWRGAPLENATITRIAELSPKLKLPSLLVALASARRDGQEGWVVLDGPRSAWYPTVEQPEDTHESALLMIHVGRQLLGFQDQPDRKKHLVTDNPSRSPEQYVAAYEKLLSEVPVASAERQKELLCSLSLLARHFDKYVDSLAEIEGIDRPDIVIRIYDQYRELVAGADVSIRDDLYDTFGVLDENFDTYIDALTSRGRSADVVEVIKDFSPHWNDFGHRKLGCAAFKAGQKEVAEKYFLRLREDIESYYYRFEEMSLLAQIWHDRGDAKPAKDLLVECLRKLILDIKQSKYNSDRKTFADEFRHHRATYLRLFPQGEKELAELDIPSEPL